MWLGGAVALAALAYHPAAPASATKTPALLLVGLVSLGLTLPRLQGIAALRRWRVSRPVMAWLALCGWLGLSLLWAENPNTSSLGSWIGTAAVAVAASTWSASAMRSSARLAATIVGGASSVVAVAQRLGGARGVALHGWHGNPNWLGLMLAVTLPLQLDLAVALYRSRGRTWPLPAATSALTGLALLLAHSRVALAALAATGIVLLAARSLKAAGATVAVVAMALATTSSGLLEAWAGRWWIWRVTAHAAAEAMPLGTGVGGFAQRFLAAQGELLAPLPTDRAAATFVNATTAHNDWLEMLAIGGPIGVAMLAAVVGLAVADLRRSFRAGAAAVVVAALSALGDSPLDQPGVLALLALVLATAPSRTPERRGRFVFMASYAAMLAALVLLLPDRIARWMCLRTAAQAQAAAVGERLPMLRAAHRLHPASGEVTLAIGLGHLELGEPDRALPWLEHSRRQLANLGTDVGIGNAWMQRSRPDRAVEAYRRALARHPAYFRAHANLVEAYRQLGRFDRAAKHLRIARDLQPGHPKLLRIAERLRRSQIAAEADR
ncbi:MAG: tetratricopeptide repeat protein [Deltaproteobacteria bacterium]|jgi:tetratricopeptide (TPR) repeat protein|nr:tetratricopeptide repeat protein [Deltaproteobacteria bacterium]MBW2536848.1 tetratricopeptide repeat protein [Deltaproteobacteria bacterium]